MKKQQLIDEVLRLDGERTQGEWRAEQFCKAPATQDSKPVDSWKIRPIQRTALGSFGRADAAFIALSSRMPDLIRDLIAQRDMAVEALQGVLRCQNFDDNGQTLGWRISAGKNKEKGLVQSAADARETLAKIKSGEWLETTVQHNTKYEG